MYQAALTLRKPAASAPAWTAQVCEIGPAALHPGSPDSDIIAAALMTRPQNPYQGLSYYGPDRYGRPGPDILASLAPLDIADHPSRSHPRHRIRVTWHGHLAVVEREDLGPSFFAFAVKSQIRSDGSTAWTGESFSGRPNLDLTLAYLSQAAQDRRERHDARPAAPGPAELTRQHIIDALRARPLNP